MSEWVEVGGGVVLDEAADEGKGEGEGEWEEEGVDEWK